MKKILIPILAFAITFALQAQDQTINGTTFKTSGNVGIGTTTPSSELEIKSTANQDAEIHINAATDNEHSVIRFQDAGQSTWGFLSNYPNTGKFSLYNYNNGSISMLLDANGNVGIGTQNPSSLFEVNKASGNLSIKLKRGSKDVVNIGSGSSTTGEHGVLQLYHDETEVVRLYATGDSWINGGKFGIGTSTPSSELEVKSIANQDAEIHINAGTNNEQSVIRFQDAGVETWGFLSNYPGTGKFSVYNYQTNSNALVFNSDGKVGVGTTDFSGNHKLRVEGSIGAREIKVEASGWSDFVFENDYELRTLEEVEQHISEKGHLPEIPSESEVTKNGINLGEMNAKLLQKIEELTLYLIEQNKELKNAQDDILKLTDKVNRLENK